MHGISRKAFEAVNGYDENFRCGEDIELSMRILEAGFKSAFVAGAHVYHKRRTSIKKFFFQVYRFGAARVNIYKRHPKELKLTHLFPLLFSLYSLAAVASTFVALNTEGVLEKLAFLVAFPFYVYLTLIFVFSNKPLKNSVGFLGVVTTLTMMFGYGWGFLKNWFAYKFLKMPNGLKL